MGDENKAKKLPQIAAGYAAAMGGFNAGVCLGWASGGLYFIKKMRGEEQLVDPWISSILNLGAIAALGITAFIMDRIGRKWLMIGAMPLLLTAHLVLAFVYADPAYIVMRFVMGVAIGCYGVVTPVYAGEVTQKELRGAVGVGYQLMITLGILYTYCMTLLPDFMWFNLVNLIPCVIFVVWIFFMPESPYSLLTMDKEEESRKALQWLRGPDYNIEAEYSEMNTYVQKKKEMKKSTIKDLFTEKPLKRAMWLGFLLMLCQQLSGINVVIFNMEAIFSAAAGKEGMMDARYQAIIIGCVQVVATLVAAFTVDRFGRRLLMMLSMLLMAIFQVGLLIFFAIKEYNGDEAASTIAWLPILCLAGYIVGFSLGAGPIPWLLMGEIFTEEAKALSAAIVAIFSWLLSFIVTWVFEFAHRVIAMYIFFLFFACLCVLGLVGLFFFMVETRNLTFDDIQAVLEGTAPENAPIGFRT